MLCLSNPKLLSLHISCSTSNSGLSLRSLIAIRALHKEGYKNLAWLAGGFNRAGAADFPGIEGTSKLQYATIGGASYFFLQILLLLRVVGDDKWWVWGCTSLFLVPLLPFELEIIYLYHYTCDSIFICEMYWY